MDHLRGEMSGAFYGPVAVEVGGVIKTMSTTSDSWESADSAPARLFKRHSHPRSC